MYIRWQSRKLTKNTFWRKRGDVHWRAILVESMRIDGKPTQRHVAYLGGITKSNIAADSPTQRVFFWNTVEDNLSALKLSTKERAAITQAIAKKIPHVTGRQRKQVERRQREILGE